MELKEVIAKVEGSNLDISDKSVIKILLERFAPAIPIGLAVDFEENTMIISSICPVCDQESIQEFDDDCMEDEYFIFFCPRCGQSMIVELEEKPLEKEGNVIFLYGKPKEE